MNADHAKIVLLPAPDAASMSRTVASILDQTRYPSFEILVTAVSTTNGDKRSDLSFLHDPRFRGKVRVLDVSSAAASISEATTPGDATYYVFLQPFCLVTDSDWLERAVHGLREHPIASMVQPEIVEFADDGDLESGGALAPSLTEPRFSAYSAFWRWPYEDLGVSDFLEIRTQPHSDAPYESMAAVGGAVFVQAETLHCLGGYDPELNHPDWQAVDYSIRAWMFGYPMVVDPTVRVLHQSPHGPRPNKTDTAHDVLLIAHKCFSPRRRDIAEILLRRQGLLGEVDEAIEKIQRGEWLERRVDLLRERIYDDDWLFSKFDVYEERFGVHVPP